MNTPFMKTPLTKTDSIVACVIDSSGSMESQVGRVCEGFNSFVAQQLKVPGDASLYLTFFNTVSWTPVKNQPLQAFNKLDSTNYRPNGGTALLDAIGNTIKQIDEVSDGKRVIVCIVTDGQENSSNFYTKTHVKDLIEARQAKGWEFVYICADMASFHDAVAMGIRTTNVAMYDKGDPLAYANAFASASTAAMNTRTMGSAGDWRGTLKGEEEKKPS